MIVHGLSQYVPVNPQFVTTQFHISQKKCFYDYCEIECFGS